MHADWLVYIPLLPALAALWCCLAPPRAVAAPAIAAAWVSGGLSARAAFALWTAHPTLALQQHLYDFLQVAGLRLPMGLYADRLSVSLCLLVGVVATLVFIYATRYMAGDPGYARFFAGISAFMAAMLFLLMTDNFVGLFFGWEGVGFASYLLIGFWHDNRANAAAASKAFVVNRVGDVGLVIAMATVFWQLGDLRFATLLAQATSAPWLALVCLGCLLAAAGKSAQLPLHVWLPDAMAGPTPVSALMHAATMVTAGVYLLLRLAPLWSLTPVARQVTLIMGLSTAVVGAVAACRAWDIKRVLAYSTMSQLGLMCVGVGVGATSATALHIVTHGLFKAALFLAAGCVVWSCHHTQDMRQLGGLAQPLPGAARAFAWGALGLSAAPVFFLSAGFYSKDALLWHAWQSHDGPLPGWSLLAIGLGISGLTAYYIWRAYYLTFRGAYRGTVTPTPTPRLMIGAVTALVVLMLAAVGLGAGELVGATPWWHRWLAEPHAVPSLAQAWSLALASAAVAGLGMLTARRATVAATSHASRWSWDEFYALAVVRPCWRLGQALDWLDRHALDGVIHALATLSQGLAWLDNAVDTRLIDGSVRGLAYATAALGRRLQRLQTGRLQTYLMGATAGILVLLLVNLLRMGTP